MTLKEAYEPFFKIGTAVPRFIFKSEELLQDICSKYNSITCENDMKPMFFLDMEANTAEPEKYDKCPAVTFEVCKPYLDFARDNKIALRGHTLVWHNQTPRWFFKQGYRTEEDAPLADRETMLTRLENYIKTMLEYVQTEYPGVIYAWDVVNEAIEDGGMRESLWTKTVGEDFVLHAFRFARKYADKQVKLFYNDYNTFIEWKREAICERILKPLVQEELIDGMGMQSHFLMDSDFGEYEKSLRCFGELGLEIQVTELDIHNADPSESSMSALADKYEELFALLLKAKKENFAHVTAVIFWGLKDDVSWLTGFRRERSYPLLFDDQGEPKEAYWRVLKLAE